MRHRFCLVGFAALLAASPLFADAPAAMQPTTRPSPQDLVADVQATERQFGVLFDGPAALADPAKRAASATAGIPMLKQIVADFDALIVASPKDRDELTESRSMYLAILAALGDGPTQADLARQADGGDRVAARRAKRTQIQAAWYAAGPDAPAQAKLIDRVESLGKDDPADTHTTMLAARLSPGAATPELRERLERVISDVMNNSAAGELKMTFAAERTLRTMRDKPLTVAGKLLGGRDFTTADWKGKVVLVDVWATYCPPCVAALPRLRKAYANWHAKGLEIVGVTNDFSAEAVRTFTAEQKMPWPELFDETAAAAEDWNPLSFKLGVIQMPRMFLIDKTGVCRSIEAYDDLETAIPKLLAE